MVLLIDTNIVLDVLLNRSEFVKDSSMVWKLCETEQAKGYLSTLTYANMMYIMRKQLTPDQIEEVFRKLNLIFKFADFKEIPSRKRGLFAVMHIYKIFSICFKLCALP